MDNKIVSYLITPKTPQKNVPRKGIYLDMVKRSKTLIYLFWRYPYKQQWIFWTLSHVNSILIHLKSYELGANLVWTVICIRGYSAQAL